MEEDSSSNEEIYLATSLETMFPLPENYQLMAFLGQGGYGQVIRCFKKDTAEIVAVKVPAHGISVNNELTVMSFLQSNHLDKYNIIRFIEAFEMKDHRVALAFENLDMTLHEYIFHQRVFYLHDVRSVTQQMAVALNVLKSRGVIHSDIKSDNIMVVDEEEQPIRVKLIDFGLAIPVDRAKTGAVYQIAGYRAPEIFLGLPLTEAIDMWSLGIVMALMVLGHDLISENSRYDKIRRLVELFGVPPDHLLNQGVYSHKYFIKTPSGHWRFKSPTEYWGHNATNNVKIHSRISSLDDLETLYQENLEMVGVDERKECIDLLKAMLHIDPNERITPSEVLNHPFITRGNTQHSSDIEQPGTNKFEEPGAKEMTNESHTAKTDKPKQSDDDVCSIYGTCEPVLPGVMLSCSPESDSSLEPGENMRQQFYSCNTYLESSTSRSTEKGTNETKEPGSDEIHEPGTNGTNRTDKTDKTKKTNETVKTDETESRTTQADEPKEAKAVVCSNSRPISTSSSQRVIFVQSAPSDCCFGLDEEDELQNESCSNGSKEIKIDEDNPAEYPTVDESSCPYRLFLATATSDDTDTEQKRKKKKNCFKRFFSWMKKTFCSCVSVNTDQD